MLVSPTPTCISCTTELREPPNLPSERTVSGTKAFKLSKVLILARWAPDPDQIAEEDIKGIWLMNQTQGEASVREAGVSQHTPTPWASWMLPGREMSIGCLNLHVTVYI